MNNLISRSGHHLAPRRVDLFSQLSKELDHAINEVFGAPFFSGVNNKSKGYPLLDAIRNEDSLVLQYTVPGVKNEDLDVEITEDEFGQVLTVSGKLDVAYKHLEKNYQIRELSSQEFRRVVRLPEDVETNEPVTCLKDGILTLTFGLTKKAKDNNKTKKIKIGQR
jgi:HSP20 family molecular chaperone IbpA